MVVSIITSFLPPHPLFPSQCLSSKSFQPWWCLPQCLCLCLSPLHWLGPRPSLAQTPVQSWAGPGLYRDSQGSCFLLTSKHYNLVLWASARWIHSPCLGVFINKTYAVAPLYASKFLGQTLISLLGYIFVSSVSGRLVVSVLIIMCCLGVSFKFELFDIANELCFHLLCPQEPDIHVK